MAAMMTDAVKMRMVNPSKFEKLRNLYRPTAVNV
jgi:hypothetical protein